MIPATIFLSPSLFFLLKHGYFSEGRHFFENESCLDQNLYIPIENPSQYIKSPVCITLNTSYCVCILTGGKNSSHVRRIVFVLKTGNKRFPSPKKNVREYSVKTHMDNSTYYTPVGNLDLQQGQEEAA